MTKPISANVRKKGRPPFLGPEADAIWLSQFPEKNYRQRCDVRKYVQVWHALISAAGETPGVATLAFNAKASRPKTFKRFPWLMGDKIQHVVCVELYGMSDERIVRTADYIERRHREDNINAKMARRIARNWRLCGFGADDEAA